MFIRRLHRFRVRRPRLSAANRRIVVSLALLSLVGSLTLRPHQSGQSVFASSNRIFPSKEPSKKPSKKHGPSNAGRGLRAAPAALFQSDSLNWTDVSTGLVFDIDGPVYGADDALNVTSFTQQGNTLYAGTDLGVYRSTDGGLSWTGSGSGLSRGRQVIKCLGTFGNGVYAGTGRGLFVLLEGDSEWGPGPDGLFIDRWGEIPVVYSLSADNGVLYAGTDSGLYRSNSQGTGWVYAQVPGLRSNITRSIYARNPLILGGTESVGMYRSLDNGNYWELANEGLAASRIYSLVAVGSQIFAGSALDGVFVTNNNGDTWTRIVNGLSATGQQVTSLVLAGNQLFAGTDGAGVYRFEPGSQSWTPVSTGLTGDALKVQSLHSNGTYLFAATLGAGIWRAPLSGSGGQQNPVPTITSISPSTVTAGTAGFTLTVNGSNFINGSVVRLNSSDRPTALINSGQLTASISDADIAAVGTASVTVFNPGPGGGTSTAVPLAINLPGGSPAIDVQPASIDFGSVTLGASADRTLTVTNTGSATLNVTNISSSNGAFGATTATSFSLAPNAQQSVNVRFSPSTLGGAGATLTISNNSPGRPQATVALTGNGTSGGGNPTPRIVRALAASGAPGATISVPVEFTAQGNENTVGFSLVFDPTVLTYQGSARGTDAVSLIKNENQVAQGRVGLAAATEQGQSFAAGTRQLVVASFVIAGGTTATSTAINLGDQPVSRQVVAPDATSLTAGTTFTGTTVTIGGGGYEADVSPRPNGNNNGTVDLQDYVLIGRFAIGLDTAAAGAEFQRADCAPRETKGDNAINLADYVQAGRYAIGLDPPTTVGGPSGGASTAEAFPGEMKAGLAPEALTSNRNARLTITPSSEAGVSVVTVEIDALGGEAALGLSLIFNPSQWRYDLARTKINGAQILVNSKEGSSGRVGLVFAVPVDTPLAAGRQQLAEIVFAPVTGATDSLVLGFGDQPVARQLVDKDAQSLDVRFNLVMPAGAASPLAVVSSADLSRGKLSPDALASAFGENLSAAARPALTLPLSDELGGTRVRVRDSEGINRWASLLYVSPHQVNYLMPAGTAAGMATVFVINGGETVAAGVVPVAPVAPALFTMNSDVHGVAAAFVQRVAANGSSDYQLAAKYDPALSLWVPAPIDLGSETDQSFLILYGTGLRAAKPGAQVTIGGETATVSYLGPQGGYEGLDQINVRIPSILRGRGPVEVKLRVDGETANTVSITIK